MCAPQLIRRENLISNRKLSEIYSTTKYRIEIALKICTFILPSLIWKTGKCDTSTDYLKNKLEALYFPHIGFRDFF